MRKGQKVTYPPNLWDDVQVHNGKLVGMLTDKLALSALPDTNGKAVPSNKSRRNHQYYTKNKTD